ncbi:uncharacterized protein [Vicugna pacos]|uniref:Uncharacterized protein isoform X3 n=1 Tax=Vicugna pacos TaxID=30538 RepID=A0ABM5BZY2_VICPA
MYFLSVRKQHAGGARRGRRRHFKGAETQTACGGGCAEPAEAFKTQDGYLVVGAGNNQQFATVCKILNLPELIDDSMYRTNHLRVQNRNELIKILSTRLLRICCIQLKTRHLLWKMTTEQTTGRTTQPHAACGKHLTWAAKPLAGIQARQKKHLLEKPQLIRMELH